MSIERPRRFVVQERTDPLAPWRTVGAFVSLEQARVARVAFVPHPRQRRIMFRGRVVVNAQGVCLPERVLWELVWR